VIVAGIGGGREGVIVPIHAVCINSTVLYLASPRSHIAAKPSIQLDLHPETQRVQMSKPRFKLPIPMA
jgi:hypothetical protein